MPRWIKLLIIFVATGLLPACGEEAQNPATKNPPPAESPAVATTTAGKERATATLLLLPTHPTARDCPQAIIQGQADRAEYRWFINGAEVAAQTGNRLCRQKLKRGDRVEVQATGTENRAAVTIVNSPPRVVEVSSTSGQALQRGDIKTKAVLDDPDGDVVTLRYRWLVNGQADPLATTETLSGQRYVKGDSLQIEITPHDGIEAGETYTSLALKIPNAPPKITSEPAKKFAAQQYLYQVTAVDPDDEKLIFRLEQAPPGMTINETGLIQWSTRELPAGDYAVTVAVEDPEGGKTTQQFSMTLDKARQ